MAAEELQDAMLLEHLHAIGLELTSEWDTLVFLYHHSTSLGAAAQIARFIGYDKTETGAALRKLEALGLIERSRVSQGIRIFRFSAPSEPGRHSHLLALMAMGQDRAGRLRLLKHLQIPRQGSRRSPDSSGLSLA